MNNDWHRISNLEIDGTGGLSADIVIGADSLWFDGHFPGHPILPGIAQLGMVFDALREQMKRRGADVALSGVSRVRFRQLLRPGDAIRITAVPDGDEPFRFRFRVMTGEQLACSGIMNMAPAGA